MELGINHYMYIEQQQNISLIRIWQKSKNEIKV